MPASPQRGDKALIAASRERSSAALEVLERGRAVFPILSEMPNIADIAIATTLALHEMAGGDFAGTPGVAAWLVRALQATPELHLDCAEHGLNRHDIAVSTFAELTK